MNISQSKKQTTVKVFAFLLVFIPLHFAYQWTGSNFWVIFSGISEGVYQHAKIGFYAYLFVCLLEYLVWRKQISARSRFFFSRMAVAIFLPWLMFLIWYQAPALFGQLMPEKWLEIVYAIFTTGLVGLTCMVLERSLEKVDFSKAAKVILSLLFIASIELFTILSFTTPSAGFFTHP